MDSLERCERPLSQSVFKPENLEVNPHQLNLPKRERRGLTQLCGVLGGLGYQTTKGELLSLLDQHPLTSDDHISLPSLKSFQYLNFGPGGELCNPDQIENTAEVLRTLGIWHTDHILQFCGNGLSLEMLLKEKPAELAQHPAFAYFKTREEKANLNQLLEFLGNLLSSDQQEKLLDGKILKHYAANVVQLQKLDQILQEVSPEYNVVDLFPYRDDQGNIVWIPKIAEEKRGLRSPVVTWWADRTSRLSLTSKGDPTDPLTTAVTKLAVAIGELVPRKKLEKKSRNRRKLPITLTVPVILAQLLLSACAEQKAQPPGQLGQTPPPATPSLLPSENPSPQPDLTAISERLAYLNGMLDCIHDKLPLESCATRVDYNSVRTRFDSIENLIGKENISLRSRSEIGGILYTISQMENERRIRWYVYNHIERIGGKVTGGRSLLPPILGGTDFFAEVALLQDQSGREAEVYSSSFHELLHAARAYERFRQGADPASDRLPVDEDYDAYYYEFLINMVARRNNVPSEGEKSILELFGLDLAKVVYDLDQSNIGPESEIFRFLLDWAFRYHDLHQNEVLRDRLALHPNDVNIEAKIRENNNQIKEIEARWPHFPQLEIIRIIEENGWCVSSFFNNLPKE